MAALIFPRIHVEPFLTTLISLVLTSAAKFGCS